MRDLECATDLDRLLELLGAGAGVIAGGTDFVPLYAAGAIRHEVIVDITRVPELTVLADTGDHLRIGAACALARLARVTDPCWAAIVDGAGLIGSGQTRRRGTIGGNVCRASPSGDTLAGLLASDAVMVARSASGQRRIPASRFFHGPGRTDLAPGEVLEYVEVPRSSSSGAYCRATVRRSMDLATVGVAVVLHTSRGHVVRARVAVSGAGPTPILVPVGDRLNGLEPASVIHSAAALDEAVQEAISPIDDVRGSAWYRRRLTRPLLERALLQAVSRANTDFAEVEE